MNRLTWRRARRVALVVSCIGYFATFAVIGQVADREPVPERSGSWSAGRR